MSVLNWGTPSHRAWNAEYREKPLARDSGYSRRNPVVVITKHANGADMRLLVYKGGTVWAMNGRASLTVTETSELAQAITEAWTYLNSKIMTTKYTLR